MNKSDLIKDEGKYKIEVLLTTPDGVYTEDYDGVIYASYFRLDLITKLQEKTQSLALQSPAYG